MAALLRVREISVAFPQPDGSAVRALDRVDLEIAAGEAVGILGESGSGKSTLCLALLRMLEPRAQLSGGVEFDGRDMLRMKRGELRSVRGDRIALIPQEPGLALNPVLRAGSQVAEVVWAHRRWRWSQCRERALEALREARLEPAERIYDAYPHQLSGGQKQRVLVAQAIANRPQLIIADEPTAALDATVRGEMLELLRAVQASSGAALLLVSHDVEVLRALCDRALVMYAGRIVEQGPAAEVLSEGLHPYTRALLRCGEAERMGGALRLRSIAGEPPDTVQPSLLCGFLPRCGERFAPCEQRPPSAFPVSPSAAVRCFKYADER